jgi:NAD(P)-dependent dehydrogenase (short-subunit alcohol dehydrogenase family)
MPGQLRGQGLGGLFVERSMADQQAVVQDAVGHVDQHVEVRAGREFPGRLAALRQAFDGKFFAHVKAIQAALPHLRRDGSITLVTAASARAAFAGTAGLAAVNGALETIVAPLAVELAPLRVNAVSPGVIDTHWWGALPAEQRRAYFDSVAAVTPARRVGPPDDVAEAIVYLAGAGFVSGTVLECTGGGNLTAAALPG